MYFLSKNEHRILNLLKSPEEGDEGRKEKKQRA
jgi:hypothetical protein